MELKFNRLKPGWNWLFTIILSLVSLLMLLPMLLVIIVSFSSEAWISEVG